MLSASTILDSVGFDLHFCMVYATKPGARVLHQLYESQSQRVISVRRAHPTVADLALLVSSCCHTFGLALLHTS